MAKTFNLAKTFNQQSGKPWLTLKNEDGKRAELMIYDRIGEKDWFSEDGLSAKQFDAALKEIPKDKEIDVRINCPGGNIWDGMAIYNMLQSRKDKVTCHVDGIAASIASVIACAGKETVMPKNTLMMMHRAWGMAVGNSDEMRKTADLVDKQNGQIAQVYADKCGGKKSKEDFIEMMNAETWLTGEEAAACGICDRVTDSVSIQNSFDLGHCRKVPACLSVENNAHKAGHNEGKQMNKEQIIALLNSLGVKVSAEISDAELMNALKTQLEKTQAAQNAKPDATITALQSSIDDLKSQRENDRKTRISNEVKRIATEGRIPAGEIESWTAAAIKDETVLAALAKLPVYTPGADSAGVVVVNADIQNISREIVNCKDGKARAQLLNQHRDRLAPVLNTNTVHADLKRVAILQEALAAFKRRVLPLSMFSTVFRNVPLEGTDTVAVPYFPLQTNASTAWNASNGYVAGNTEVSSKKITIDQRYYQAISLGSDELSRQPYLNVQKLVTMNADKLGYDVFQAVCAKIVASAFTNVSSAIADASMDVAEINKIKTTCDGLNWPVVGRGMALVSGHFNYLLNDSRLGALNYGGVEPIRQGRIPNVSGFELYDCPNIPENSEKLVGWASFASALLIGFAPIPPKGEVANLTTYLVVTDPDTGISMEYRRFGDAQKDTSYEVVESNYGIVAGEAAALVRIVKP